MRVPLATSAAQAYALGAPAKVCHNVMVEPDETDPDRQVCLVETEGSLQLNTFAGAIRGIWQTDGHANGLILIAQGSTVSTYNYTTAAVSALTGSIAGSDDGDLSFTESEAFGLFNTGLYVSDGSAIAAVTDADFATLLADEGTSGFTSVATIGQRGIATYGSRFCFTEVDDLDSTTSLNYYTAESSPDAIVAARVLGDDLYIFGSETVEIWAETGDANDPLSKQRGRTIAVGSFTRDTIVEADNTLWWLDNNRMVRRLAGAGAEIVSEPWVTAALASATSIRAWTYVDERKHTLVGFYTPEGTYVYDVAMQRWHTRASFQSDTWRWRHFATVRAQRYVGDATGAFDLLGRDYTTEHKPSASVDGDWITREFTAHLPVSTGRPQITTVRLDCSKGIGLASGQGSDPLVQMRSADDGGQTWSLWRDASLGRQGEYSTRTIWRRCGRTRSPGRILHFRKSDPVKVKYQAVWVNEDALT